MLVKKVTWPVFKEYLEYNHIFPDFVNDIQDYYEVFALKSKSSFIVKTTVDKTDPNNPELIEFEGEYFSKVDSDTGKISTINYENLNKDELTPIILDPRVSYMYIKNIGSSNIDLFINSQTDFFTLEPKDDSIKIPIFGKRDISIISKSNGGNVQIIAWGIE